MKPGKSRWLLRNHPNPPDLEAPVYNLRLIFKKNSSLTSLTIIIIFQFFTTWKIHFQYNKKIPGNLLKKLEKSWNFISPKKWEPCCHMTKYKL